MSNLHEVKTNQREIVNTAGTPSARAGTRTTRTRAKTARALGHDFTPTQGWRERSQIRSSKMVKSGQVKGFKKQAQETVSGDAKKM